jgi:hypothetical protein
MPRLLAQPRKSEAENSSSKRSSFQMAEQYPIERGMIIAIVLIVIAVFGYLAFAG